MFKIFDNFVAYDKNKQPYTFSLEKHTETANLHAGVTEAGFALKSIGNRFILNSPGFTTGKLDANFAISYPYESTLRFQIIFGYDKKSRTGSAVQFTYDMGDCLTAELVSVKNGEYTPVSGSIDRRWRLPKSGYPHLSVDIKQNETVASIDDVVFRFEHTAEKDCSQSTEIRLSASLS